MVNFGRATRVTVALLSFRSFGVPRGGKGGVLLDINLFSSRHKRFSLSVVFCDYFHDSLIVASSRFWVVLIFTITRGVFTGNFLSPITMLVKILVASRSPTVKYLRRRLRVQRARSPPRSSSTPSISIQLQLVTARYIVLVVVAIWPPN